MPDVAVAGVVFVLDNLLHGCARADFQCFQLDLYHRHAIDEEQHIIAVMAVVGVDAELVHHREAVFAPLLDIDQSVKKRRAIVPLEAVALTQMAGGGKEVRSDDLIEQPGKLCIRQMHTVQRFKLFTEVLLKRSSVTDVGAVAVFEIFEFFDQTLLDLVLCCHAYAL